MAVPSDVSALPPVFCVGEGLAPLARRQNTRAFGQPPLGFLLAREPVESFALRVSTPAVAKNVSGTAWCSSRKAKARIVVASYIGT